MNPAPHPSRLAKLQDRLAQSRYWSISLIIHAVLIAGLSTLVLIEHSEPEMDFVGTVPEGSDPSVLPPSATTTDEKPKTDLEPRQPQVTTSIPPTSGPATSASPIQVVSTTVPTVITVGTPVMPQVPSQAISSGVPSHLPDAVKGRFQHDSRGHIVMKPGRPGTPTATDKTEDAVLRGLVWLRDHQNPDGSWGERSKGAMTGLALLAFLGHGETDKSEKFGHAVAKGIQWTLSNGTKFEGRLSMTEDGWGPGNGGVYEHAILTYALGEYYILTQDKDAAKLLEKAVGYIVQGQGPDGGWMYHYDKTQGDTSVSGWQVQALKVAHLTKLGFPGVEATLDRAMVNFDRVQGPKGGYGYRAPGDRYSLSGVGVLCELFWKEKRDGDLRKGVQFILDQTKSEPVDYQHAKADLYAWYYHTQAMLMFGGSAWVEWERQFRPMALASQAPDGSWPVMKVAAHGGLQTDAGLTGGVYRTSLCVLMLESYYRYLGTNQAFEPVNHSPRLAAR